MDKDANLQQEAKKLNAQRKSVTRVLKIIVTLLIPALKISIPIIAVAIIVFWTSATFRISAHNHKEISIAKQAAVGTSIIQTSPNGSTGTSGASGSADYGDVDTVTAGGYTYPVYDDQFSNPIYNDLTYGPYTMHEAACGAFSAAMIIAGLTNDPTVTPVTFVEALRAYYGADSAFCGSEGSYQSALIDNDFLSTTYGLKSVDAGESEMLNYLEQGYPVLSGTTGHVLAVVPAPDDLKQQGYAFYVLDSIAETTGPYKSVSDYESTNGKPLYLNYAVLPGNA